MKTEDQFAPRSRHLHSRGQAARHYGRPAWGPGSQVGFPELWRWCWGFYRTTLRLSYSGRLCYHEWCRKACFHTFLRDLSNVDQPFQTVWQNENKYLHQQPLNINQLLRVVELDWLNTIHFGSHLGSWSLPQLSLGVKRAHPEPKQVISLSHG